MWCNDAVSQKTKIKKLKGGGVKKGWGYQYKRGAFHKIAGIRTICRLWPSKENNFFISWSGQYHLC